MTITAIQMVDAANPVEVQAWLDANPSIQILHILIQGDLFYALY
jgi:hypothetical protein